jgi:hypothetical protein
MDAIAGSMPSEIALLLWAPIVLVTTLFVAWLVVLIAFQHLRPRKPAPVVGRQAAAAWVARLQT